MVQTATTMMERKCLAQEQVSVKEAQLQQLLTQLHPHLRLNEGLPMAQMVTVTMECPCLNLLEEQASAREAQLQIPQIPPLQRQHLNEELLMVPMVIVTMECQCPSLQEAPVLAKEAPHHQPPTQQHPIPQLLSAYGESAVNSPVD
jgi:hypothetical protein